MNPFVSVVNQKRNFAELLQQQAVLHAGESHLVQALLEAAAMHLRNAYYLYLGEIAATYQCKNAVEIHDLWSLIANLQLNGKNPAETAEIYNLQENPDSWLSQLQHCCETLSVPPETVTSTSVDANRIPAFSTAQRYDWSRLEGQLIYRWITSFTEMVDRHREAMVEF